MRRSVRALPGVLAVVAVLVAAPTAQADGSLMVNNRDMGNAGCVFLGSDDTRTIENNTDSVVTLFPLAGCEGDSSGVLAPGEAGQYTSKSAQIG
ncbi:hypothetical protein [Nocardia sp. NPDC049149]|uniref:hypothetical protein n=1 Tax=Nocardia sp. NPDC049149 TaxID=3364315 RepID=UPI003712A61E